jgi:hypothetical protein
MTTDEQDEHAGIEVDKPESGLFFRWEGNAEGQDIHVDIQVDEAGRRTFFSWQGNSDMPFSMGKNADFSRVGKDNEDRMGGWPPGRFHNCLFALATLLDLKIYAVDPLYHKDYGCIWAREKSWIPFKGTKILVKGTSINYPGNLGFSKILRFGII